MVAKVVQRCCFLFRLCFCGPIDYDAVTVGHFQDPYRRRFEFFAVEILRFTSAVATSLPAGYETFAGKSAVALALKSGQTSKSSRPHPGRSVCTSPQPSKEHVFTRHECSGL